MSDGLMEPLFCPACSYDLRGSAGDRCPECGHDLSDLRAGLPVIPWTVCGERRWIPAFWATVWLVTFRPRKFLNKFGQTVEYRDARRFQCMVVLHAYLPMLIATVYLYVAAPPGAPLTTQWAERLVGPSHSGWNSPTTLGIAYYEYWPAVLVHIGYLLFLFSASGVQSYFFHPKSTPMRLQNNAVAMSYYAAAPMAWTPVIYIVLTAILAWSRLWYDLEPQLMMGIALHVLAALSLLLSLLWTWGLLLFLGTKLVPQEAARWWLMAAALLPIWKGLGVICLAVIPAVVMYVLIIIRSLTG